MNKTLDEATELIESMSAHNFSWTNERAVQPTHQSMIQLSGQNALEAKLDSLTNQISQLMQEKNSKAILSVNQVSATCLICGSEGHLPQECTLFVPTETQLTKVNYAQNQGAFSQNYNPAWRNHPNLSYKNANQQGYPQAAQQNYASTSQQNFRPQGNMQFQQQQPQQHPHQATQQNASSGNSQSKISEMMRLQK